MRGVPYPRSFPSLWALAPIFALLTLWSWAEPQRVTATDKSLSLVVPADFKPVASPPDDTLIAYEVPNGEVSLFVTTGEKVDFGADDFAEHMQIRLEAGGAEIIGTAQATLGGKPAVSFLVGKVKPGKESLFVFNLRDDEVCLFILNYPAGSRSGAATLWQAIAPTITFHAKPAKKEG